MGRISHEEGSVAAVGVGDLCAHVPVGDTEHLELGGGVDQRRTHEVAAAIFGEGLHRFGLGVPAVHEHPLLIGAVIHERAAGRGVDEEVEHTLCITDERAEVRAEMHHHERLDRPRPGQLDAERASHGAGRAVGGEQVTRVDPVRTLRPVDIDGHPVRPCAQRRPRVAVADIEVRGQQQRFEPVLAEVADRRRGDRQHLVALPFERQRADDVAAEPGDPVHFARLVWREALVEHGFHVDARLAPDLEGSSVDDVCSGRALRPVAPLQDDGRQPEPATESGGGQPGRAGADDHHVDALGGLHAGHQNTPS